MNTSMVAQREHSLSTTSDLGGRHRCLRHVWTVLGLALLTLTASCTIHRDINMIGGGIKQPIHGYLQGKFGSGSGEIHISMPQDDGIEEMTGPVTFYWGSGYKRELAALSDGGSHAPVSVTEGEQRMCRGTLIGPSGTTMECLADVDANTGHGVGECIDSKDRHFTWHF